MAIESSNRLEYGAAVGSSILAVVVYIGAVRIHLSAR
jgi:hypothetical protein